MYSASINPYMCTDTKRKKTVPPGNFTKENMLYCVHACVYVNIQEYQLKNVIYTHTEYIGIFILVATG